MHQIFADLCPFENFCKLFAAYCLEVIVCKFYFIIGIFFANNYKFWSYGQDIDYFFFFFFFFFFSSLIRFARKGCHYLIFMNT